MADNDDLLDYEDEEQPETTATETQEAPKKDLKGTYVSIHSSGFRDFLLKPEILRAIVDCGFEHPSEGKKINQMYIFVCNIYDPYSATRMHTSGRLGHGHPLSSQVWYGKNCCLCSCHFAATRTN